MKKLLIITTLTIFCLYGCKSVNTESETSSHVWKHIIASLGDSGLYANIMNLYCNEEQDQISLTFNDKIYSKMEAYYKNESNLKKLVMMKDPTNFLEEWFGCDYNKEVCRDSTTENKADTYQVLTYNVDGEYSIEFKEFSQNTNLSTTLKEQIQNGTAKQLNYFAIIRDTNEVLINTALGTETLKKHKICESYNQALGKKYRYYNSRNTHSEQKEASIEINGKKFDTVSSTIYASIGEASHTSWMATSGELKGFGVKVQTVASTCRTYKDTIVISQKKLSNDSLEETTKNADCKEFLYLFNTRSMKEYKFTPMVTYK